MKSVTTKKFKTKLWESLSILFASLLLICMAVNYLGGVMKGQINEMLGLQSYELINPSDKVYYEQKMTADNIEEYYRQVNVDVEGEGLVLLKNDNGALPLDKGSKVSLTMSGAANIFFATHGPGVRVSVTEAEGEDELIDLKVALEEDADMKINSTLYDYYLGAGKSGRGKMKNAEGQNFFLTREKDWKEYPANVKDSFADYGDAAIVVLTRESGEGMDVSSSGSDGLDGSYLSITAEEKSVLEALAEKKANKEIQKIVVLINSAVTLQCDFLFDESLAIDAAMWIGLPGGTGTRAVAQALVGDINPSGKLSDTFLKDNFAAPAAASWKENGEFALVYENADELGLNATQKYYGVYVEGIYVGYRYFETRYEDYVLQRPYVGEYAYEDEVAYPFGHGLSYSEFEYTYFDVSEVDADGNYTVSAKVKNVSDVAGKEVVQVYLQKPYSEYDQINGVEKASVELAGFAKTEVLAPGEESEMLTITVNKEQFKAYDADNYCTYVLSDGEYYLTVATDSHNAINNILMAKGANVNRMVGSGNADMAKMVWNNPEVDYITYSTSTETGNLIENQLDFMDPNRYDGVINEADEKDNKVTYVSRSNWTRTFPTAENNLALALTEDGETEYDITSFKPIEEEEGAKMPTYGKDNGLTLAMFREVPLDGTATVNGVEYTWDDLIDQMSEEEMCRLLTGCYGYTLEVESITKPMTDEDDGPYGVSNCDDGYSSMSCAGIIASTFNVELYAKVGEAYAADARSGYGGMQKQLHGLYSPGINMHRCAFGGRAAEYFSEDPILSGFAAVYQIQAMQEQGVVAHPKHYIFNDEESQRNGICIWANEQSAREIYLMPWEMALRPSMGNAHAIMTSFNRAGCIWTSASSDLMEDILIEEWAFDGYSLTDMAESNGGYFMTHQDGFMNGTSCFLGRAIDEWPSELANSPTFNLKIREATKRILYVISHYSSAMNGYDGDTKIQSILVWWELLIYVVLAVCAIMTGVSLLMYRINKGKEKRYIKNRNNR